MAFPWLGLSRHSLKLRAIHLYEVAFSALKRSCSLFSLDLLREVLLCLFFAWQWHSTSSIGWCKWLFLCLEADCTGGAVLTKGDPWDRPKLSLQCRWVEIIDRGAKECVISRESPLMGWISPRRYRSSFYRFCCCFLPSFPQRQQKRVNFVWSTSLRADTQHKSEWQLFPSIIFSKALKGSGKLPWQEMLGVNDPDLRWERFGEA